MEDERTEIMYSSDLDTMQMEEETIVERRNNVIAYLRSGDFVEVACCVVFALAVLAVGRFNIPLNERPIPYQQLEDAGDVVMNLSLSEQFEGDTVSGAFAYTAAHNHCIHPGMEQQLILRDFLVIIRNCTLSHCVPCSCNNTIVSLLAGTSQNVDQSHSHR